MGPRQDIVGEIYHGDRREDDEDMELGLMTPVNSISLAFFLCQLFDHFIMSFLLEYGTSAYVIIRVFTHCFALLTCIHFLVAVVIHH
jgi:hypothetical protein